MANAVAILERMRARAFKPAEQPKFVRIPVNEDGDYVYDEVVVDEKNRDEVFPEEDLPSLESVRIPERRKGCRHDVKECWTKKRYGTKKPRRKNVVRVRPQFVMNDE